MTTQPFFMVYLENEKTPAFIHTTLDSAENEAKRLARIYKKKAFVLCSIKASLALLMILINTCTISLG